MMSSVAEAKSGLERRPPLARLVGMICGVKSEI